MSYYIRKGKSIFVALGMHNDLICTDPVDAIKKGSIAWYVYKDGAVVGYATARELEGCLYLNSAGIIKEARGKGLQKRLIQCRVKYAKRRGLETVITYTSVDNAASINNLIACGFRAYTPAYAWAGAEWVYWRRVL